MPERFSVLTKEEPDLAARRFEVVDIGPTQSCLQRGRTALSPLTMT